MCLCLSVRLYLSLSPFPHPIAGRHCCRPDLSVSVSVSLSVCLCLSFSSLSLSLSPPPPHRWSPLLPPRSSPSLTRSAAAVELRVFHQCLSPPPPPPLASRPSTAPSPLPHPPVLLGRHHILWTYHIPSIAGKLQALVYDILPSTTAVFSYAIGSRKLSANEQFFVGAQTVVSVLQTTQIKQGVSFIAANKVYTSANKTTIV